MVDIELEELKREFLRESEAKVLEIRSVVRTPGARPSEESLESMINLAHQLKGAGGSYGYEEISREAAVLEDALEQLGNGGSQQAEGMISAHLDRLDELIHQGSESISAASSVG